MTPISRSCQATCAGLGLTSLKFWAKAEYEVVARLRLEAKAQRAANFFKEYLLQR